MNPHNAKIPFPNDPQNDLPPYPNTYPHLHSHSNSRINIRQQHSSSPFNDTQTGSNPITSEYESKSFDKAFPVHNNLFSQPPQDLTLSQINMIFDHSNIVSKNANTYNSDNSHIYDNITTGYQKNIQNGANTDDNNTCNHKTFNVENAHNIKRYENNNYNAEFTHNNISKDFNFHHETSQNETSNPTALDLSSGFQDDNAVFSDNYDRYPNSNSPHNKPKSISFSSLNLKLSADSLSSFSKDDHTNEHVSIQTANRFQCINNTYEPPYNYQSSTMHQNQSNHINDNSSDIGHIAYHPLSSSKVPSSVFPDTKDTFIKSIPQSNYSTLKSHDKDSSLITTTTVPSSIYWKNIAKSSSGSIIAEEKGGCKSNISNDFSSSKLPNSLDVFINKDIDIREKEAKYEIHCSSNLEIKATNSVEKMRKQASPVSYPKHFYAEKKSQHEDLFEKAPTPIHNHNQGFELENFNTNWKSSIKYLNNNTTPNENVTTKMEEIKCLSADYEPGVNLRSMDRSTIKDNRLKDILKTENDYERLSMKKDIREGFVNIEKSNYSLRNSDKSENDGGLRKYSDFDERNNKKTTNIDDKKYSGFEDKGRNGIKQVLTAKVETVQPLKSWDMVWPQNKSLKQNLGEKKDAYKRLAPSNLKDVQGRKDGSKSRDYVEEPLDKNVLKDNRLREVIAIGDKLKEVENRLKTEASSNVPHNDTDIRNKRRPIEAVAVGSFKGSYKFDTKGTNKLDNRANKSFFKEENKDVYKMRDKSSYMCENRASYADKDYRGNSKTQRRIPDKKLDQEFLGQVSNLKNHLIKLITSNYRVNQDENAHRMMRLRRDEQRLVWEVQRMLDVEGVGKVMNIIAAIRSVPASVGDALVKQGGGMSSSYQRLGGSRTVDKIVLCRLILLIKTHDQQR